MFSFSFIVCTKKNQKKSKKKPKKSKQLKKNKIGKVFWAKSSWCLEFQDLPYELEPRFKYLWHKQANKLYGI